MTLRRYCQGSKRAELQGEGLKQYFLDAAAGKATPEEHIFPNVPESMEYMGIYERFVKYTRAEKAVRSFQSLNTGTKNTLEPFYHVMEHIPYLIDATARTGYQGGFALNRRPRVEKSLIDAFGVRGYYAIAWYCICNWQQMTSTSTYRPHEALGKTSSKETAYWKQYKHRVWFQLAYCLLVKWNGDFSQFPGLAETLKSVKDFAVQPRCNKGLNTALRNRD
jgi:hypothetical protein